MEPSSDSLDTAVLLIVHLTTHGCYHFLLSKFGMSTCKVLNFHGPAHKGLSDMLFVSAVLSQHISILF